MDHKEIKLLLEKYSKGECSLKEKLLVEDWYRELAEKEELGFIDPNYDEYSTIVWSKIQNQIHNKNKVGRKQTSNAFIISVAASLLIAISLFAYWQLGTPKTSLVAHNTEIIPGDNRASLYLSDGTVVLLDQIDENWNAKDQGVIVKKLEGGLIAYEILEKNSENSSEKYHTIKTPKGGQFQVILPDSTKVWLNTNSSLRLPVKFDAAIREVELDGEAYFEVNKRKSASLNQDARFQVRSKNQVVEVLGTHFNISAYQDDTRIKTTLLEGSVRVSPLLSTNLGSSKVLTKAGQQAQFENNEIQVTNVNVDHIIDWKNGYFVFNNEDLLSILRKVARWYDVEIEYPNKTPILTLDGSISKYENIESVLSVIEFASGVKLSLKGRRISTMQ